MMTALKELKLAALDIDEIEGVIEAQLSNPLRMIPVRGYDQASEIENIRIKIYYYSDDDEDKVTAFIKDCQQFNPIYRLVEKSTSIDLSVDWVL